MAFSTRAYYEQTTNQGVLDRIEIQEDGFSGSAIELKADGSRNGFKWRLSEITSESDKGLINPLANQIQVGKLTFFPRIETSAEQTLLDDILGSPDSQFRIVWKQDGSVFWTGNIDNKRRSYPETGGSYFATIRANDFEILKSIDYTLDDTRQTLITTIADLLGNLNFGLKIRTATSWITEDTTDSTDFLSQIYHETKALREFARTGDETDQPISVWDALLKVGDPALLFRQVNGEFTVEQLTEFDDPENVHETLYTSAGAVDTATTTVDRTLDADKATSEGSLVVKDGSPNDRYPAIKRARIKYDHRTQVSTISFADQVTLDSGNTSDPESQLFISDGDQRLTLSAEVEADINNGESNGRFQWRLQIASYYWDHDNRNWTTTTTTNEKDMTFVGPGAQASGSELWIGSLNIETDDTPSDADGTLTITLLRGLSDSSFANKTRWKSTAFNIVNPIASENSESVNYQLTQTNGYTTKFKLTDTWFGDGPLGYSPGALRHGSGDGDLTSDSWQRRGTTTGYRSFHKQLLKEVLDLQRTNTRKLDANFWGSYDPTKILVYDSQNFYCAGVSYHSHLGRWKANLFRINIQTGSDDFDDIPKFTDETGSGTGSSGSSGGGGGGLDESTADKKYFKQDSLFSEISGATDLATARQNLGFTDGSADLDLNSVTAQNDSGNWFVAKVTDDSASDVFRFFDSNDNDVGQFHVKGLDGAGAGALAFQDFDSVDFEQPINGTTADFSGTLDANTLRTDTGKFLAPTSYAFRNAGDTGFRDVEMAGLTANDNITFNATNIGVQSASNDQRVLYGSGTGWSDANGAYIVCEGVDYGGTNSGGNIVLSPATNGGSADGHILMRKGVRINTDLNNDPLWISRNSGTSEALAIGVEDRDVVFDYYQDESSGDARYMFNINGSMPIKEFVFNDGDGRFKNNLFVEGGLFAKEFVVDQTRVMYNYSMSPEGGKIATVSGSAPNETITFEDEDGNEFVPVSEGSILRIQERTGLKSGVIVKSLWRKVSDVTGNNVTLTDSGISYSSSSDVGSIAVGDYAVQKGHTSDTDLDGRIDFKVSGVDKPYVSIFDGVGDVNGGFEAMRFGWSGQGTGHEFDSAISGQTGIMGATESDGAVFWITEEEAKMGEFTIKQDYLTNGKVYIGNELNRFNGAENIQVGYLSDGSTPLIRAFGDVSNSWVGMFGRSSSSASFFRAQTNGNVIVEMSSDEAKFFGAYADATDLWGYESGYSGDTSDKSNASVRLDFANGQIFYDAMGDYLYNRTNLAGFSKGDDAAEFNRTFKTEHQQSGGGSSSSEDIKVRSQYFKPFGINTLKLIAYLDSDPTNPDGAGVFFDSRIHIRIYNADETSLLKENTFAVGQGEGFVDIDTDISNLSDETEYIIRIVLEAEVDASNGTSTETYTLVTTMEEKFNIIERT